MMHNSATSVLVTTAFSPSARASGTDQDSSAIDTNGFQELLIIADVGVVSTNVAIKVRDSADNSTYADLTGAAFTTFTGTAALTDKCERYIKIRYTSTGAGNSNFGVYVVGLNYAQAAAFTANTLVFNLD
jgi:hypothetical protein